MTSWLDRERQRLEGEKRCSRCGSWLPLESFPVNRRMHLGRSSQCRECARAATRDWRERNPEYVETYNAARRAKYPAKRRRPNYPANRRSPSRPEAA